MTTFFISQFSDALRESDARSYFESRGFAPEEFVINMVRPFKRPVSVKVTFKKEMKLEELIKRLGTNRPEIEKGQFPTIRVWKDEESESRRSPSKSRVRVRERSPEVERVPELVDEFIQNEIPVGRPFSVFFIGNLSHAVNANTIVDFLVSKGFATPNFAVQVFRVKSKDGSSFRHFAKLTIYREVSLSDVQRRIGTRQPEIENGRLADIQTWFEKKRRASRARNDAMPDFFEVKSRQARATPQEAFIPAPSLPVTPPNMIPVTNFPSPEQGQQGIPKFLPLITTLTNIIQQQNEIIKSQTEALRALQ